VIGSTNSTSPQEPLPSFINTLLNDLKSDDVEVRKIAAIKLSEVRDPRTLDFLKDSLKDPDDLVRYFLEKAVDQIVRDKQLREAVRVLGQGDPSLDNSQTTARIRSDPATAQSIHASPVRAASLRSPRISWLLHLTIITGIIIVAVLIPGKKETGEKKTSILNQEGMDLQSEVEGNRSRSGEVKQVDLGYGFSLVEKGTRLLQAGKKAQSRRCFSKAALILKRGKDSPDREDVSSLYYYYYYMALTNGGADFSAASKLVKELETFYTVTTNRDIKEKTLVHIIGYYFNKTLSDREKSPELILHIREYRTSFPLGTGREDVESIAAYLIKIKAVELKEL